MIQEVVIFTIASALFSALISIPIIEFLYYFKIVRLIDADFSSIIDSRRLKAGTPIMGGLVFVISLLVITFFFNLDGNTTIPLFVVAVSAALGAFDDVLNIYGRERSVRPLRLYMKLMKVHASKLTRVKMFIFFPWYLYKRFFFILGSNPGKGIQAHEKIIIQAIVGAAVAWWIYGRLGWSALYVPFFGYFEIGILMPLFIVFMVVMMANAVNISDGMDGLSAGMLVLAFISFACIAILNGHTSIALMLGTTVGGLLTYLYFNIPPARFQMGDVGSLSMGALLATISFPLEATLILFIIAAVFIAELASVIIQGISRRLLGRRFFKMAPLHHHFEMNGWSEEKVVMRFWIIAAMCGLIGVWLSFY